VQSVGHPNQSKRFFFLEFGKLGDVNRLVVFVAFVMVAGDRALGEMQGWPICHRVNMLAQAIEQTVFANA
jgi:hypothetical protein